MSNRQITSIVILLLCGMAYYVIPSQTDDGEAAALAGSSLMPTLAVGLIFVFSLLDLVFSFWSTHIPATHENSVLSDDVPIGRSQIGSILAVSSLLGLFALILLPAGYVLAGILLLIGHMVITGGRQPLTIIVTAVVATSALYLGLRYGFGIHISAFPQFLFKGT